MHTGASVFSPASRILRRSASMRSASKSCAMKRSVGGVATFARAKLASLAACEPGLSTSNTAQSRCSALSRHGRASMPAPRRMTWRPPAAWKATSTSSMARVRSAMCAAMRPSAVWRARKRGSAGAALKSASM
jgi:hypothetical protein